MDKNLNYQQARRIRHAGIGQIFADQLDQNRTVGQAIKRTISLKVQSRVKGVQEKFDPLNIAKFLTMGSSWAPALLGHLTGRSHEDTRYFSGRLKPIVVKAKSSKITPLPKDGEQLVEGQNIRIKGINDQLYKIYKLLKKSIDSDTKRREMQHNFQEEKDNEAARRHKEFMKVLSAITGGESATIVNGEKPKSLLEQLSENLFNSLWPQLLTKVPLLGWFASYVTVPALAGYLFNEYWQSRKEEKSNENIQEAQTSGGATAAAAAAEMERLRKEGDEISDPVIREAMEVQQGIRDDAINRMEILREDFYKHSGFKKKKSLFGRQYYADSSGKEPSADMAVAAQQFADDQYSKIWTGEIPDPIGKFVYKSATPVAKNTTESPAPTPAASSAGAGRGGQGGPTAAQAMQNTSIPAPAAKAEPIASSSPTTKQLNVAMAENVEAQLDTKQKAEDNVTVNNVMSSINKKTSEIDSLSELSVRNDEPSLMDLIVNQIRLT